MGSSSSKPSSSSAPQVWTVSSPTSVSHDLASALQSSPETDTSRQQALELEIQARVAAELKRLRAEEAEALKEAQQKLSEAAPPTQGNENQTVTRHTVSKEVEALRAKLLERKKVREIPGSVEAARSDVVRCLRENDRRPLDCWREIETFKEEVRRLEKGWVEKVVS